MPVKQRRAKARITDEIAVRSWSMVFGYGADYLGRLKPLGIKTHEQMLAAAPGAWRRWGRAWLSLGKMGTQDWALQRFGEPERCR